MTEIHCSCSNPTRCLIQ